MSQTDSSGSRSSGPAQAPPVPEGAAAAFGPNEWLVDELYQRFLEDKESVDRAWWDFFEDYRPTEGPHGQGSDAEEYAEPAAAAAAAQTPQQQAAQPLAIVFQKVGRT
ncbi:MAG: 2-oxoglutarate dehydrogenase E1 subunit family protein, partial [Actinomycetota bacterium]